MSCGVVRDLSRSFTGREIFSGLIRRNFFQFGESDLARNTKMVMTNDLPNGAPQEFKDIVQLACLEVWGGNRRVNHSVELPGWPAGFTPILSQLLSSAATFITFLSVRRELSRGSLLPMFQATADRAASWLNCSGN